MAAWHHRRVSDRVRIVVDAPGSVDPSVVELREGEGILLGRAPDAARAGLDREMPARMIPSPSVSANHAAVWCEGDEVHVRDLASRNGTWLRVPSLLTVTLPRSDVQIRLASGVGNAHRTDEPETPRYRTAEEFSAGISTAVREWLERHDFRVRVWVEPAAIDTPVGAIDLRLITGERVLVQSTGTVDERFHELMAPIARFVAAQNALYAAETETRDDGMILASPELRAVHRRVVELAKQGVPRVVLLGPSGTGKERLARAFHRYATNGGPLVTINCASLGRDRLVADLFGAEAGAYTGAQRTMVGAVERADGGTLFLDEIGDMPLDVQPQLLRFLDTGEYQRLGAVGLSRTVDVKVVAATNLDLRQLVADGRFRADLFYRLGLEVVEVPPLRQRFADVLAYLESQRLGELSVLDALAPEGLELLRRHRWDGNFRELVNLVHRLPRDARRSSLDAAAVQRALDAGSLAPVREVTVPLPVTTGAWSECLQAALDAYLSQGHTDPATWSDVVVLIEQYLKPHAMVRLAELRDARGVDDISIGRVAERVKADRGTVLKQLRAYFDSKR